MVVAEVSRQVLQGHYAFAAPVEEAVFVGPVLDYAVEHLAHEEAHGVFVEVAAYAGKGMDGADAAQGPQ